MARIIESNSREAILGLVPPILFLVLGLLFFQMTEIQIVQYLYATEDLYFSPIQLKLLPAFFSFLFMFLYNKSIQYEFSGMPFKYNFLCGLTFFIYLDVFSVKQISIDYLLFLIAKSSSILIIVFVGTFLPFFSNKYHKLTQKQILISCFLTIINLIQHVSFNIYYATEEESTQTNFLGYAGFFIYLIGSAACFNLLTGVKEEYHCSVSELAQKMNLWLFFFLAMFTFLNESLLQMFKIMSHNMIFTLYILTLSFAWIFIQVFAFKLIKNFRLHIFPMVLFTFNSIKFQVYNEDVSVGVVLVYSVLISGLACLTIHFEIERTKKKMVGEGGGSEVGLQVRGNVQTYEMMGN